MKTAEDWRAEVVEAVRLERNFWQLVVVLALIFGLLGGAGIVRLGACHAPTTPMDFSEARAIEVCTDAALICLEETPRSAKVDWLKIVKPAAFDAMRLAQETLEEVARSRAATEIRGAP